jgi:hypothetical protein
VNFINREAAAATPEQIPTLNDHARLAPVPPANVTPRISEGFEGSAGYESEARNTLDAEPFLASLL